MCAVAYLAFALGAFVAAGPLLILLPGDRSLAHRTRMAHGAAAWLAAGWDFFHVLRLAFVDSILPGHPESRWFNLHFSEPIFRAVVPFIYLLRVPRYSYYVVQGTRWPT